MPAPFEQVPFALVPERPRVPHPYFASETREVDVSTPELGRVRTHVRVHGSGPPLLCVHGFMTTSYSFRYLFEALGDRFTMFAPDLVGCGRSDKPDLPYGPDAIAGYLVALVDALGLRGAPVIGNSLGGYLSMRAALLDPGAFSRLVNLHSPGLPTRRMRALRGALDLLPGWKALVGAAVARSPERWVHRNVHYWDETLKSREEHRAYATPLRTEEGRRAFLRMLDETLDVREMRRFEATLRERGRFPIPLQLVYARRDPMVPPAVGERLAALLPHAELVWLDEASHFAHVDATARFADVAARFLLR